jgi:hypothetical protein
VNREELGLVAEANEDIALTEMEARVWRRKLDSRRKNRIQGSSYISHTHATASGLVRCGGVLCVLALCALQPRACCVCTGGGVG